MGKTLIYIYKYYYYFFLKRGKTRYCVEKYCSVHIPKKGLKDEYVCALFVQEGT